MGSGLITASGHDGNRTYWLTMGLMAGKPGANPEMNPDPIYDTPRSSWPHRLALLLVGMTFPLIWVGGLVTTYDAGMSVPDWPNTYGYNLLLYPWSSWISGPWDLFIEHGHRLLAVCVGLLTIGLLIVTWLQEPRRWVKWLSVGCLTMVLLQGALGGARVLLDEILLAQIHGVIGPLFFLICVALAAVTSRWWQADARDAGESAAALRRPAWMMLVLASVQLLLGSHLRHLPADWPTSAFRYLVLAHLIVGVLLLLQSVVVFCRARRACRACRVRHGSRLRREALLGRPAAALVLLVAGQILLGVGSWLVKYSWPTWLPRWTWNPAFTVRAESMLQAVTVTAHVAVGSLILATAFLLLLRAARRAEPVSTASKSLASLRNMESPA